LFLFLLLLPSVLMDPSIVGSLLVRSRPTTVVVTPTPTEIVPYKIPTSIIDYVLANRYTGEGHPGEHLLYLSQLCSLFKLAGVTMEFVMKKLFSISLKDKASDWYKLLDNSDFLEWQELMSLFYAKFYPLREIHQDRNYIYNFWSSDGESIAQAWGRLKSLMLKFPNHELPKEIILTNFYVRLSCQEKEMLDSSSSGVFQTRSIEEKLDLIERIQKNTEDWEIYKGIEPAINYEHDYIESHVKTDYFNTFCSKIGLDSQLMIDFCKEFASHVDSSKKKESQHHKPFKESPIEINVTDPVLPAVVYEQPPYPSRIKEHSFVTGIINKNGRTTDKPEDLIKVKPQVAMVKDLVTSDIEESTISFCDVSTNIVTTKNKGPISGTPVVSVKIGDHNYYGLCDLGSSVSAIPFSLYQEIMHEIQPCEIEYIDVTINLANKQTISPVGIVRDVEVLCGKVKYPTDFLVLVSVQDSFCPIIFGRPFLSTCGAIIDWKKGKVSVELNGEPYEFNFSKFSKQPRGTDLSSNDKIIEEIASIAIPPNDTLEQFMEDHENGMRMQERDELEDIFLRKTPILKHNLPVEPLGILSQPKEDPVFDIKPLPDTLKYAYLDEKKVYHVIINSNLLGYEEERLLETQRRHQGSIGYTLDDLKGISPSIFQHTINLEPDAKPVVDHQRRLNPRMKDVVRTEVLKLLAAGIIYPIADSRWVSPVHCVPKKGGMTVVPNDKNELIPQRVVIGYRMCIDCRKLNKATRKDHYPLPFID